MTAAAVTATVTGNAADVSRGSIRSFHGRNQRIDSTGKAPPRSHGEPGPRRHQPRISTIPDSNWAS